MFASGIAKSDGQAGDAVIRLDPVPRGGIVSPELQAAPRMGAQSRVGRSGNTDSLHLLPAQAALPPDDSILRVPTGLSA